MCKEIINYCESVNALCLPHSSIIVCEVCGILLKLLVTPEGFYFKNVKIILT